MLRYVSGGLNLHCDETNLLDPMGLRRQAIVACRNNPESRFGSMIGAEPGRNPVRGLVIKECNRQQEDEDADGT